MTYITRLSRLTRTLCNARQDALCDKRPPGATRGLAGALPAGGRAGHPGRTTPRIRMEPAPAMVTFLPGRGACTIAPSPTYNPTWPASSK
ncbi:hypothetical protein M2266_003983 [Streptomyces sp. SPB162]|nr:hypothetical protein [Streptomyces sp. SPB162]